ncbi:F-box protein [Ananas comosus]|uniref:F-box protein n=1 Tax=Ananas comosus TaxID=4615 RepID=A0A199VGH7_ANACO|nr:F-box protein [Ananas comosus]
MEPLPRPRDRRVDALGDLCVLPDEVLCAILDLLPPSDLGRLACVSSVMYILCNEEPLWMSKCLSTGGLIEYKGSWRKTTLCRLNLCAENEEVDHKTLHFDGFNSLFLYRRWYRRFTALSAFSFDSGTVERIKDLSLDEFKAQYDGQKPVLLTELAETWPARTNWTIDQLLPSYGDVAFRISQRSPQKIRMKFKDYVSYMEVQHDEDPLYIFDDKFGESAPALLEDYSVLICFMRTSLISLIMINGLHLDGSSSDQKVWCIVACRSCLTSAWNTLLCGGKDFCCNSVIYVLYAIYLVVHSGGLIFILSLLTTISHWNALNCLERLFLFQWLVALCSKSGNINSCYSKLCESIKFLICMSRHGTWHRVKGVCRAGLLAIPDEDSRDVEPIIPWI